MKKLLKRIFRSEVGAGLVEYAILFTFVAVIAAVGLIEYGGSLHTFYNDASATVGDLDGDVSP